MNHPVKLHPLAVVGLDVNLGRDVEIGPFCVVESGATIGDGCRLEARVVVKSGTTLGDDNRVFEGAVLGGLPQHVHMPLRPGTVEIGSGNTIRENVTIHRALEEGHATIVGDRNLLMVNVHVAHDCRVGSNTIFANNAMLAGHVTVDDRAYLSGAVAVHQFCRIGRLAMVGGQAHVARDIPPYVTIDGGSGFIVGLNQIGLKRNGYSDNDVAQLKAAYRLIYRSGLTWEVMLHRLKQEFPMGPAAQFYRFLSGGQRGFAQERRLPPKAAIRLREDMEEAARQQYKAG